MPRLPRNKLPSYRLHKARGLAVVTLGGKDFYLGAYGSKVSRLEYDRIVSEWISNGRNFATAVADNEHQITVTEVIAAYWGHAQAYYVKDNRPTSEQWWIRLAMRPLRRLYGTIPASGFGPLALKTVRQAMIEQGAWLVMIFLLLIRTT